MRFAQNSTIILMDILEPYNLKQEVILTIILLNKLLTNIVALPLGGGYL